MILGVIIGEFAPNVQSAFDTVKLHNVSARAYNYANASSSTLNSQMIAIAIGLIAMMWPILTKVQYECLPTIFSSRRLWIHVGISLILNWIIGPLVMLAVAWATLPDLPTYRTGVIMVGLARCIAMVMIWNQMARGDHDYCAILVIINSVLQIILYSPYAVLFINIIGNTAESSAIHVSYGNVAISVLIVRSSSSCTQLSSMISTRLLLSCSTLVFRYSPAFSLALSCGPYSPRTSSSPPFSHILGHSHCSASFTPSSSCSHTRDTTSCTTSVQYSGRSCPYCSTS